MGGWEGRRESWAHKGTSAPAVQNPPVSLETESLIARDVSPVSAGGSLIPVSVLHVAFMGDRSSEPSEKRTRVNFWDHLRQAIRGRVPFAAVRPMN